MSFTKRFSLFIVSFIRGSTVALARANTHTLSVGGVGKKLLEELYLPLHPP